MSDLDGRRVPADLDGRLALIEEQAIQLGLLFRQCQDLRRQLREREAEVLQLKKLLQGPGGEA